MPVSPLSLDDLPRAYGLGYFPMSSPEEGVYWLSPDPRAVFPLEGAPGEARGVAYPRSLRSRVGSGRFTLTTDAAFERVIAECARRRAEGTWISGEIVEAYARLHREGDAHSIEAWLPGREAGDRARLVGGLYGVHLGGAFFEESMFSRPAQGGTDASKVCFIALVRHLRARGFVLLDTQFWNPHVERLGAVEITRREYLRRLERALERRVEWAPWTPMGAAEGQ